MEKKERKEGTSNACWLMRHHKVIGKEREYPKSRTRTFYFNSYPFPLAGGLSYFQFEYVCFHCIKIKFITFRLLQILY